MKNQAPVLVVCFGALMNGCISPKVGVYASNGRKTSFSRESRVLPREEFAAAKAAPSLAYASVKQVEAFGASAEQEYRLGPGDKFAFIVRGRPEISREEIVVSPDGEVALPRAGVVNVGGRSLKNVTYELTHTLKQHYEDPEVTLVMKLFANNRVFVLGRVANPGAVPFNGRGSLLEALSLAGGLPVDTGKSFLSRCMIVRGSEMVVWVDLRDLLENGNMALNAKLQNGDVIFIPQSEDQLAYVMGQVVQPGVHVLRSSQTVLDAVMSRGGPNREADVSKVILARQVQGRGMVEQIDLREILTKGDMRKNYTLKDGDIVYVGESGASKINYFITRLLPSMQVVDFALRTAESTGALAELRRKLWGQEGFVGTGASPTSAGSSGK